MAMTQMTREELLLVLKEAKIGDKISEQNLLIYIRNNVMNKRIGKYLGRNRQVENDDLRQEFMIGVALAISKCDIDIGDPIEYIIAQGVYRVRSCLRGNIIKNTVQICRECGSITRLNRIRNEYICKKCGSNNIDTQELTDNNDIALENAEDMQESVEDSIVSQLLIEGFESTLKDGTNIKNLYDLLKGGVNRDNPQIKNYIREISMMWGGCSEQNVVQALNKLQYRLRRFADDNGYVIVNNRFVDKEYER